MAPEVQARMKRNEAKAAAVTNDNGVKDKLLPLDRKL